MTSKRRIYLGLLGFCQAAVFFFSLFAFTPVHATPQVIRVDGSIFDNAGNPYSGATSIGVKAYTAASGGTLLWTAPSNYTPTATNGRFTLDLDASVAGPTNSLTSAISSQATSTSIWFELSYSGNTVRPRIRSRGTAFAVSSAVADSANALQGVSVSTLSPVSGNVLTYNGSTWLPGAGSAGGSFVSKLGDTMSGALNVGANVNAQNLNATNVNGTISIGGNTMLSVGAAYANGNQIFGGSGSSITSGAGNSILGYQAGTAIATASGNTFMGYQSGQSSAGSGANTFIGYQAGKTNNSIGGYLGGGDNTFVGALSGTATSSGYGNTFMGESSGGNNTTGFNNVYIGYGTGFFATTGSNNTLLGTIASLNLTTGSNDTVLGGAAGGSLTSQSQVTLLGTSSNVLSTGLNSVALGFQAVINASSAVQLGTGTNSTNDTLQFNNYNFLTDSGAATFASINGVTTVTSAYLNGLTGNVQSQINSLTGGSGSYVSKSGDTMSGALNVGANVNAQNLAATAVNGTISIGGTPMISVGTGYGAANLVIGGWAAITVGTANTFTGRNAGVSTTAGANNSFFGYDAGVQNSTGSGNSVFGASAGVGMTTGNSNSYFGFGAGLANSTGSSNSAFGDAAGLSNTTGSSNSAFGQSAGFSITTGSFNTALGNNAGFSSTTGTNNVFLGDQAGFTVSTQNNMTILGANADSNTTASQAMALGYSARILASSAVQLGAGTNSTANSLQFNGYNFLTDSGAATFASINGVTTVTSAYLNGLTGNVQSQINSLSSAGSYVALSGGTMTGNLQVPSQTVTGALTAVSANVTGTLAAVTANVSGMLDAATVNVSGLTANQLVSTNANKNLVSTATATLTGGGPVSVSNAPSIIGGTGAVITVNTATTAVTGVLTSTDWNTFNSAASSVSGKVNRSGDTMTGTLAVTSGQIYTTSQTLSGATANFATTNVNVLSAVGGSAITLTNMQDGGAYTVIVTDTTARPYTFAGCTPAVSPSFTGSSGRTIFSIMYLAATTTCFITWVTGF